MAVELDSLTIKDLEARYGVTRSNIYNRINGLKDKGYPMEPEKQGGKSIFNADQVAVMDALDSHIKAGNEIASFPGADGVTTPSYVLQDKAELTYKTQDTHPKLDQSLSLALVVDAIAGKLQELTTVDSLGNLRSLWLMQLLRHSSTRFHWLRLNSSVGRFRSFGFLHLPGTPKHRGSDWCWKPEHSMFRGLTSG